MHHPIQGVHDITLGHATKCIIFRSDYAGLATPFNISMIHIYLLLLKAELAGKRFSEGLLLLPLFPTFRDRSADFSEIFGPGSRVIILGAAELRPG